MSFVFFTINKNRFLFNKGIFSHFIDIQSVDTQSVEYLCIRIFLRKLNYFEIHI